MSRDLLYKDVREICYDPDENVYMEEGFIIDNIYTEILPIFIELFRYKFEDLLIKDRSGNSTLLWVV